MNRLIGTNGANYYTREGHYEGELVRLRGGDDSFTASQYGNDVIYGEAGNDFIDGRGGDDRVSGGGGHDTIYGGDNNDRLYGNAGNDYLSGGSGADVLAGNLGNDWLIEQDIDYQSDLLLGGRGDDTLAGTTGMDVMVGGAGNDTIQMMGGYAYGDGAPQEWTEAVGRDSIATDLGFDYGTNRFVTGGGGADHLNVLFSRLDGVATAVHYLDFDASEGDTVGLHLNDMPSAGWDYLRGALDTNHQDWVLDAQDGSSALGSVTSNATTNTLTMTVGDGDALILHGATSCSFDSIF